MTLTNLFTSWSFNFLLKKWTNPRVRESKGVNEDPWLQATVSVLAKEFIRENRKLTESL